MVSSKELKIFVASWCQVCKQITDDLDKLNLNIPVKIFDVDVDSEISDKNFVNFVPTFILCSESGIKRLEGTHSSQKLGEWING
jgi:thiol-disulfide isomerase/thioredoxin